MIEEKIAFPIYSISNYQNIDLWQLSYAYNHSEGFIKQDSLYFEAQVGFLNLTGNELFYYPLLAKTLREVNDYPRLKRKYDAPKALRAMKGIDFLLAFVEFVKKCNDAFENERTLLSTKVNNLIQLYGAEKTPIIINQLIKKENDSIKGIEINGVAFEFYYAYSSPEQNPVSYITLSRLMAGDVKEQGKDQKVHIEDVIAGTSYMAVRYRKSYQHAGHVVWYDLNTLHRVSIKEINTIRKKRAFTA